MSSNPSDELLHAASAWFARLNGGAPTAEDLARHDAWLSADQEHRAAYAFVVETWALTAAARPTAFPRASLVSSPAAPAQPVHQQHAAEAARRRRVAWAAAAGLAVAALTLTISHSDRLATRYRTAIGEVRTVVLDDGSTVALNAASYIAVRYTGSARRVELYQGEALFTVAKNSARPFRVNAGDRIVQATGTAFDIDRHGAAVDVAVSDGAVAVYDPGKAAPDPSSAPSAGAIIVSKGQAVAYMVGRPLAAPHGVALEQIGAWRNGWLSYERMPLARLVDDLNRQFEGRISIDSRELASMPVSLTLRLRDRDTTLHTLERLLPVHVVQQGPKVAVLVPRGP